MTYKYKENKIKSGRPRNEKSKDILPAISVNSDVRVQMNEAAKKLGISHAEFRRMAYELLIKYVSKQS